MKSRTKCKNGKSNSSSVPLEDNVSETSDGEMVDEDDETISVEGLSKKDQPENFILPVVAVPDIDTIPDFVENNSFGNKSLNPRSSCLSSQEGDPDSANDEYSVFVPDSGIKEEIREESVSPFASVGIQSTKPESSTTETLDHKDSPASEGIAKKISPLLSEEEEKVDNVVVDDDDDNDDFCFLCRDGGGKSQEKQIFYKALFHSM